MFTLIIFEILLFEGWSVLSPAQQNTGSKRVNSGCFGTPIIFINFFPHQFSMLLIEERRS